MRSFFLSAILLLATHFIQAQQLLSSKDDLYPYEGTFDLGNNHRITLGIFDEFKSLVYLDLKTLKLGLLIPVEKNIFRDNNDSTKLFMFSLDKNNNVEGLKITMKSQPLIGKRVSSHTRKAVSFVSGKRTLKGDLYIPTSKGPHPAVVFAHGSGPSTRSVSFLQPIFYNLALQCSHSINKEPVSQRVIGKQQALMNWLMM